MDLLKKFTGWISVNVAQIKSIVMWFAVLIIAFLFLTNGCKRRQVATLNEQQTQLTLEKMMLQNQVKIKDDSLILEGKLILRLLAGKQRLEKDSALNAKKISEYEKIHSTISSNVNNIPDDSSYRYLQAYYPYSGEKKFPFNGIQVKMIHIDVLEKQNYKGENNALKDQLSNCEQRVSNVDSMKTSYQRSFLIAQAKCDTLAKLGGITQSQSDLYKKQMEKFGRRLKFWRVTTAIGAITTLVLLI